MHSSWVQISFGKDALQKPFVENNTIFHKGCLEKYGSNLQGNLKEQLKVNIQFTHCTVLTST